MYVLLSGDFVRTNNRTFAICLHLRGPIVCTCSLKKLFAHELSRGLGWALAIVATVPYSYRISSTSIAAGEETNPTRIPSTYKNLFGFPNSD